MTASRTLALCADDYGLLPCIDRGIRGLAVSGRLTEISCLVTTSAWPAAARRLSALACVRRGQVRTGLHFNLTEGQPLSPQLAALWPELPSLKRLIVMAHLHRLPMSALRAELKAQFTAFEQAHGKLPSHLDGHQHVHHLPQVRSLVLELLGARRDIKVRHTGRVHGPGFAVKRLLIEGTGGRALGQQLEASGLAANSHLLGVYDFKEPNYRGLMQSWLAALPAKNALIFCHPGALGGGMRGYHDPIAKARTRELNYLRSQVFENDLLAAGVRLI